MQCRASTEPHQEQSSRPPQAGHKACAIIFLNYLERFHLACLVLIRAMPVLIRCRSVRIAISVRERLPVVCGPVRLPAKQQYVCLFMQSQRVHSVQERLLLCTNKQNRAKALQANGREHKGSLVLTCVHLRVCMWLNVFLVLIKSTSAPR